ncbi:MAG: hypothetical protein M3460_27100 [Actinomycetota bacterium]|nr:hypothetical protein [Actinomycetota bacterium]
MTQPLRRAVFGPVLVTSTPAALAAAMLPVLREGWVLAWLLLRLTACYALSGSA